MSLDIKIIEADEGKVFRRKGDGQVFGNKIYLGYTFYLNGEKLETPKLETEQDFEQIDKIIEGGES